ncbi:MAG: Ig-like domain-containing protein [Lentimicrobiaceae bacterium]|nr:Ig-like domain-containing protein [Lentimicrobiaceae bacterium]
MKKTFLKITAVAALLLIVAIGCKKDVPVTGVTLNETVLALTVGATEILTATVLPNDATNKNVNWVSSNPDVAMVEYNIGGSTASIAVIAKKVGAAIITVTTNDGNHTAICTVTVTSIIDPESEWVEINGVKWATRNVDMPGTFAATHRDAGMFYQWNRKIGWSSIDPMVNSNGGTTWDDSIPEGDTWEKENDPCPTGWRVPTVEELESLVAAGSEWISENGVNGRIFGNDDNTLFLPAAGYRNLNSGTIYYVGTYGLYWSSSIIGTLAYALYFYSTSVNPTSHSNRAYGFSVRCVAE